MRTNAWQLGTGEQHSGNRPGGREFMTLWFGKTLRWPPVAIAVTLVLLSGPSFGQSEKLIGNMESKFEPTYRSGALMGCGLSYKAVIRDHVHRGGELSIASGAFGVIKAEHGGFGGYLKLRVLDISVNASGQHIATPGQLASAYLLSQPSGMTTSRERIGSFDSEPAGMIFSTYNLTDGFFKVLQEAAVNRRVTVMYGRKGASLDAPIPLELDVVSSDDVGNKTRNTAEIEAFVDCLPRLVR